MLNCWTRKVKNGTNVEELQTQQDTVREGMAHALLGSVYDDDVDNGDRLPLQQRVL